MNQSGLNALVKLEDAEFYAGLHARQASFFASAKMRGTILALKGYAVGPGINSIPRDRTRVSVNIWFSTDQPLDGSEPEGEYIGAMHLYTHNPNITDHSSDPQLDLSIDLALSRREFEQLVSLGSHSKLYLSTIDEMPETLTGDEKSDRLLAKIRRVKFALSFEDDSKPAMRDLTHQLGQLRTWVIFIGLLLLSVIILKH